MTATTHIVEKFTHGRLKHAVLHTAIYADTLCSKNFESQLQCSLFFTRYVMLPGVAVDLPQSDLKMQPGDSFVSVLTIGHHEALYFEGNVHNLRSIEARFFECPGI